jgi:hypothetical protein
MHNFPLVNLLLFTMMVPLAIGIRNRKFMTPDLWSIWTLMLVCLITQSAVSTMASLRINNLWVGHIYVPLEFVLLANAYRLKLKDILPKKGMLLLMVLFPLLALMNTLFLQDLTQNNSHVRTLESALLIFLALSYFYHLMKHMPYRRPEHDPFFWINTAVLIYLSSSLFLFMYSNVLLKFSKALGAFWHMHKVFLCFYYSAIAIGLWILPKK